MPDLEASNHKADKPVVQTGQVFSDGLFLELIQGSNCELGLLSWDGKSAKTAGQFVRGDETFPARSLDGTEYSSETAHHEQQSWIWVPCHVWQ